MSHGETVAIECRSEQQESANENDVTDEHFSMWWKIATNFLQSNDKKSTTHLYSNNALVQLASV